jgi:hypothetical protein
MTIPEIEIDFVPSLDERSGEGVSEVFRDYCQGVEDVEELALRELHREMDKKRSEIEQHFRMLRHHPHQPTAARLVGVPIDLPVQHLFSGVQVVLPSLGTLLGVWLQARFGRKVRIKVGDTEVEARTPEELEKLLTMVRDYKKADEPKRIIND